MAEGARLLLESLMREEPAKPRAQWSLLEILCLTALIATALATQVWMQWDFGEQVILGGWFIGCVLALVVKSENWLTNLRRSFQFPGEWTALAVGLMYGVFSNAWSPDDVTFSLSRFGKQAWTTDLCYPLLVYSALGSVAGASPTPIGATACCSMT